MAKFVTVFACVALFQIASALECYHCDKESCEKDVTTWQKSKCGKPTNNQESVCLKFTYKEPDSQKLLTSRKCVIVEKDTKYKCVEQKDGKPFPGEEVVCDTCTSDLCNSAAGVSLSFAAISGVFVVLLAPKMFS